MKLLQLFSHCSLSFFTKNFDSLFNIGLGQDGLIWDDVGWWSGLKKVGDRIYDFVIGLWDIVEGMGSYNQVVPSHRAPIGYSILVADGGRIL